MNIAELKVATQQHGRSSGQAYIQVGGVLYPVATIEHQLDGLIIVADAAVSEDTVELENEAPTEKKAPPTPEAVEVGDPPKTKGKKAKGSVS